MSLVVQERYELDQRREVGFFRSLQGLLDRFTDSQCTEQKDKIFALVGLFAEEGAHNERLLQVDYGLKDEELYLEVMQQARYWLEPFELQDLRVYVSSALQVDPSDCERRARRAAARRQSQASRQGWTEWRPG